VSKSRYLNEAVKDSGRRLRDTSRSPVGECLGTARGNGAATLRDLACPSDHTQSYRGTEDLKVVIVYLVLQSFLTDLIEALELVEIDGIAVRHNQAVKNNGHSPLLAEACGSNLLRFAQDDCSFGNEDALMVMRIQRI
jgi:hypothetical protein